MPVGEVPFLSRRLAGYIHLGLPLSPRERGGDRPPEQLLERRRRPEYERRSMKEGSREVTEGRWRPSLAR